jgi:four helix bundle protein
MAQNKEKSLIKKRTYEFALRIIDLYRMLISANEYVLSKQLLKAGTSIGANVEEAIAGQSRADFLSKMSIASKEARESNYWLRLIKDSKILESHDVDALLAESSEIIRILTSIVKTTSLNNSKLKIKN